VSFQIIKPHVAGLERITADSERVSESPDAQMLPFSSILSAVKPRDRTEQYKILAAMYAIDAHDAPVTAKQINELLRLHLGSKAPPNVNASLRTYTAYVEPAAKGPPLQWRLTTDGIERLRSQSGLALPIRATASDFECDIAFVCALEDPEFAALEASLGGSKAWSPTGSARFAHVCRSTELVTKAGQRLKVVATTATSMGLTAAAIATTQLIFQFKPRLVAMVGIAAGTHDGKKQFGDVLIADPTVDYNSGKVVLQKGVRTFLPDPYPIGLHPRIRSVLNRYRARPAVFDDIRKRWKKSVPKSANRAHVGPVGAADQVIDDPSRIVEIQRNWRKLIGVEMETYGVYRACYEAPDPKPHFMSFKSVCDFASAKTDSWQDYAAFVAAEFAVGFFADEWESLWPQ
jgi:nucleoside phosphorylase